MTSVCVACDVCGLDTMIPDSTHGAFCATQTCSGGLVLRPVGNNQKYVRTFCRDQTYYWLVEADKKNIICKCCNAEFTIAENVIEMRNQQKIYRGMRNVLVEELLENARKDLRIANLLHTNFDGELESKEKIMNEILVGNQQVMEKLENEKLEKVKLQKENDELKDMMADLERVVLSVTEELKVKKNEDSEKMEALETENCSLVKKVAELEQNLEQMTEKYNLQSQSMEKIPTYAELLKERENIMAQLEIVTKEKNQLFQVTSASGRVLMEQVNTLMVTNMNLSTAVAKLTADAQQNPKTQQKPVEEKQESPKPSEQPENDDEPVKVTCHLCGEKTPNPEGYFMIHCGSKECAEKRVVLLSPIDKNHRFARHMCKTECMFSFHPNSEKNFWCPHCLKEYALTDTIVEIRNNQNILKANPVVLTESDVDKMRTKIVALENKVSAMDAEINVFKRDCEMKTNRMRSLEDENAALMEELHTLREQQIERSNENEEWESFVTKLSDMKILDVFDEEKQHYEEQIAQYQSQIAQFTEMNTILMKKIQDFRGADKK